MVCGCVAQVHALDTVVRYCKWDGSGRKRPEIENLRFPQQESFIHLSIRILSNNLLSRLTPHAEEITGDHQCEFWRNRSNTDHLFCIRQMLQKKWEYNEAVHQLSIDFKKAYDSVRREVLYNILMDFGIP